MGLWCHSRLGTNLAFMLPTSVNMKNFLRIIAGLLLACVITPALAQTVSIPDPGLDSAVRTALGKPTGPLTQQDLLNLTFLNAQNRSISNLAGLEAARNLSVLLL